MTAPTLQIEDLSVDYRIAGGDCAVVRRVSLRVFAGECVGIVGESGSGKTQLFMAVMGLLTAGARTRGSVRFAGQEILSAPRSQLNKLRGSRMTMVFQDPQSSLTPHLTIGVQMAEVLVCHANMRWRAAEAAALEMLRRVQVPDAERRLRQYPHELSGGLRQRVMIGMSLLCEPDLLIADEPTTSLDATIQAQVIDLLGAVRRDLRTAVVLISHDLAMVGGFADRIFVMYAGRIVENADVADLFGRARHPYTAALINCAPSVDGTLGERLATLPGQPPDPAAGGVGCAFAPRCPRAADRCRIETPLLRPLGASTQAACHYPLPP